MTTDRSLRTFFVALVLVAERGREPLVRERGQSGDEVRPAGARGLVRQRPDRQAVPAQLLRGGDRRDPERHRSVRRRRGGHHAGAPGRAARRRRRRRLRPERRRLGGRLLAAARRREQRRERRERRRRRTAASSDGTAAADPGRSRPTSTRRPVVGADPLLVLGGSDLCSSRPAALGYLSRRRQAAHADDLAATIQLSASPATAADRSGRVQVSESWRS